MYNKLHRFKSVIFIICMLYFILHSFLIIFVQQNAYFDNAKKSDVVIILGTSPTVDKPNPCLVARVRHGVDLYNYKKNNHFILSGGQLNPNIRNESEVMREIALDLGLSEALLNKESESKSTYENLVFSQKIMKEKSWQSAIIVSDPHHLPRASLIAKKLGINFTISPAINSPCSTQRHNMILYWFFEPIKIIIYGLTFKI